MIDLFIFSTAHKNNTMQLNSPRETSSCCAQGRAVKNKQPVQETTQLKRTVSLRSLYSEKLGRIYIYLFCHGGSNTKQNWLINIIDYCPNKLSVFCFN